MEVSFTSLVMSSDTSMHSTITVEKLPILVLHSTRDGLNFGLEIAGAILELITELKAMWPRL